MESGSVLTITDFDLNSIDILRRSVLGFHNLTEQILAAFQRDLMKRRRPEDAEAVPEHDDEQGQRQRKGERQRAARRPNERLALTPEASLSPELL